MKSSGLSVLFSSVQLKSTDFPWKSGHCFSILNIFAPWISGHGHTRLAHRSPPNGSVRVSQNPDRQYYIHGSNGEYRPSFPPGEHRSESGLGTADGAFVHGYLGTGLRLLFPITAGHVGTHHALRRRVRVHGVVLLHHEGRNNGPSGHFCGSC